LKPARARSRRRTAGFIHIYGDLSYARKAGIRDPLFLFFFWHPATISRSAPSNFISAHGLLHGRREFGVHKYRNGHGSPLKRETENGEGRGWRSGPRGVLADLGRNVAGAYRTEVVERLDRFRVYELTEESIKHTSLGKSCSALLFNKTPEERTAGRRRP